MSGAIGAAIEVRYAEKAESCCSLSCGGALDHGAPQIGEVVVDLGSGRGSDVMRAADLIGADGRAIGVDMTGAMLSVARKSAQKAGLGNVNFIEADIAATTIEGDSVDLLISNCTINHAIDKVAVWREVWRILRPGGRFVVSDVLAVQQLPPEVVADPTAWAACYGGAVTREIYFGALSTAGFRAVEVLEESEPYEKGGVAVISLTLRGYKKI